MAFGAFSLTHEEHQKLEVLRKIFAPTKEDLQMASKGKPAGKPSPAMPPSKHRKGCK